MIPNVEHRKQTDRQANAGRVVQTKTDPPD